MMLFAIFAQFFEMLSFQLSTFQLNFLKCCLFVSLCSVSPLTNAPVRSLIWKWAAENFHRLSQLARITLSSSSTALQCAMHCTPPPTACSHYPLLLLLPQHLHCTAPEKSVQCNPPPTLTARWRLHLHCTKLHCTVQCNGVLQCAICVTPVAASWYLVTQSHSYALVAGSNQDNGVFYIVHTHKHTLFPPPPNVLGHVLKFLSC